MTAVRCREPVPKASRKGRTSPEEGGGDFLTGEQESGEGQTEPDPTHSVARTRSAGRDGTAGNTWFA
jgi:hypothetical protein